MFECDQCGLCCIGLNRDEEMAQFHDGDGICRYLDLETKRCSIYETRPIKCRVDDFYKEYLADKMDYGEFLKLNYEACELKKKEYEDCGRDIYKMVSVLPELEPAKKEIIAKSLEEVNRKY